MKTINLIIITLSFLAITSSCSKDTFEEIEETPTTEMCECLVNKYELVSFSGNPATPTVYSPPQHQYRGQNVEDFPCDEIQSLNDTTIYWTVQSSPWNRNYYKTYNCSEN